MLRAIFAFHRDVRGWNDIGYNFVIDAFGRIFEARAGGSMSRWWARRLAVTTWNRPAWRCWARSRARP
jgi:hypothetical protein